MNQNNYQTVEVKSNGCEVTRQHPKEIKPTCKAVNVTAQCLFTVSIGYFGFKL